jgi:hypothetical protein
MQQLTAREGLTEQRRRDRALWTRENGYRSRVAATRRSRTMDAAVPNEIAHQSAIGT